MLRRVSAGVLLVVGCLAPVFLGLVVSSRLYDRSNPRDRANSHYSEVSAVVDRPVKDVFRFVQYEIPSVYTRMSPMHEKFEILNAEAAPLAVPEEVSP